MYQFDVIGIGQVCIDYLGKVKKYPGVEGRVELEKLTVRSGGPTATALLVLARFGMRTSFIGKVGDDDTGKKAILKLQEEGIDTSFLVSEEGKETQVSFIPIEEQSGRRTVFWSRGSISPLKPTDLKEEAIAQAKAVHFDDLFTEAIAEAARIAKKHNVTVSMDADSYEEGIGKIKDKIDLLIVSENFMSGYSGETNPRKGIKKLKELGALATIVTLGDQGSLTFYKDELIETPAYRVRAVDTTGAGDVFHGAFLYGWLRNWEIKQTLKFASAAAAMNCLGLGAHGGVPKSTEEVFDFMKEKTFS